MKKTGEKLPYDRARADILRFENSDIITASGDPDNTPLGGNDWNIDSGGWT